MDEPDDIATKTARKLLEPKREIRGHSYVVTDRYNGRVIRPNRIAAGMTLMRNFKSDDARTLSVYGTLDILRGAFNWRTKRSARMCSCCGQRIPAVVLSDRGRARLARLRRIAVEVPHE